MQNPLCRLLAMAVLMPSLSMAAGAQTIKTFINFSNTPAGLATNPATNKVYVVAPNIGTTTDDLAVIDGSQDVLLQNIAVPSGALFVTADYFRNQVYVAGCNYNVNPSPCTVTIINGKTNAVTKTIQITTTPGFGLTGITVNPLNGLVYVANANDDVINIIDGCKKTLVGKIDLSGNNPSAITINPLLNRLYVPYGTNLTAVVDTKKKQVISTTTFGSTTVGAAANLKSGNVFVTDDEQGPSTTGVLDKNGAVLATIQVDDTPLGVDVDPFTNLAFVAVTALDELTVIDGSTNTIKSTLVDVPANYVAVNVATQKVYVSGRNGVTVLTEK